MNIYLLIIVIFFALGSTIALWFRVYNLNRSQGLFAFWVCFPMLPLLAWTHKEKCRTHLILWFVSMLALTLSIVWMNY